MGHAEVRELQTPKPIGGRLPEPPVFGSLDDERQHRKLKLAAAFRIFARFGPAEGIAGHITVRDPEFHYRAHQVTFLGAAQHGEAAYRHHHRAADSLQDPRNGEFDEAVTQPAKYGGAGEHDDRAAEHRTLPKAVGHPSANGNEDRERQQIGSHADTQAHGRDAECGGHVAQGGRDHRRIQILHEIGTGDDQRNDD